MAKRPSKKILEALADLAKALRQIEAPSMVIGGIAVIAHGVARQTVDIDATVLAARLDTSQILEALADCSISRRPAGSSSAVSADTFRHRHRLLRLTVDRNHTEILSHGSKSPIERPQPALRHQRGGQQVHVDPADPPSAELARQDQLQHLFIWNQWRRRKPLQIRDHGFPSRAKTAQDELSENPRMEQNQVGFEMPGELRRTVSTAKEVDPDRRVDQNHWASSRTGRRREATSISSTFPRSSANRRRAASSTSAFRPSRTATDFVGAPVTRTASSRRSRSISSVVLMHRVSHKSYA